jgi:UDP-N-acetylmuramoyl-tripeptide--D-alanyl-D-alanine ligase
MARSSAFSTLTKSIFSINDFLYLLQLQEYYNLRYFLDLPEFFWRRDLQQRQKLEVTSRIKLTKYATIGLMVLFAVIVTLLSINSGLRNFIFLIIPTTILIFALIPLWVGIVNLLLTPVYSYSHNRRRKLAAQKVAQNKDMQIIAIAGSFGKTTTKNFIEQLIKHSFRIQMIPGNINTPTGIATWINKNLADNTQILIVEMDTYNSGEIAASCKIAPPDIALLTTVGDQHLLRFGSRRNLALALLEIYRDAKSNAKRIVSQQLITELESLGVDYSQVLPAQSRVLIDLDQPLVYQQTQLQLTQTFSSSTKANLAHALKVAELLNIPVQFIQDSLQHLALPERRQSVVELFGFSVIDDSYNLSPTTARMGLAYAKQLATEQSKKLLVITAGIPELGIENLQANYDYGADLAASADQLVLLQSILISDITDGLAAHGYTQQSIISASRMSEAWELIQANFKPNEYLILMQPELNDLYY